MVQLALDDPARIRESLVIAHWAHIANELLCIPDSVSGTAESSLFQQRLLRTASGCALYTLWTVA
jgi:hypothetical protein